MKQKITLLLAFLCINAVFAQNKIQEDIVYLKNGGVLRGSILEQIPNESLKIQIVGNNIFVLKMDEVARIVKENAVSVPENTTTATVENIDAYKQRGFTGFGRIGALIPASNYLTSFGFSGNGCVGYQFNRNFTLCLGAGADYYGAAFAFPLFLDAKFALAKGKVSPTLGFAGGYSVGLLSGLMLNPSVGLKIQTSDKLAFTIDLGYKNQSAYISPAPFYYGVQVNMGTISLHTGMQF